ncbi:MAG: PIN domain-containing protein [Prevotellaceae bacterium]|jgi:predicted nucleic acid-binding protein|nr:PIN domain-containing protein [Prevotellaceae bacterium]
MQDKIFIDSNIVIYAYSGTEIEKSQVAKKAIKNNKTVISTQVLHELANTLHKKFHINYLDISATLNECLDDVDICYMNKQQTVFKACSIAERYGFSFYDSLIIAAAIESECPVLYSEDMQHNQIIENKLTILNPFIL